MTGGFAQGSAARYAGGLTSSAGTSTRVVREAPKQARPATQPAAGPGAGERDLSRLPGMLGAAAWQCPFPSEAEADRASVQLRVSVDRTGRVTQAAIVSDPGQGFGREAKRCVFGRPWSTALDRSGNPVPGTVVVLVHFIR
jgi:protein TonB